MRLDIVVNSVMLATGLGLAFWASLPESAEDSGKVAIIDIPAKSVSAVKLETPSVSVKAERTASGERFWIDYQKKSVASASDAVAPVDAPKERFLGNQQFDEFLASFAPLKADRVLGRVSEDKFADFGLDGEKSELTISTVNGKSYKFFLGKKSFGSANRFLMEAGDTNGAGKVLLVSDQVFDNLDKAQLRMFDRRIVSASFEDIAKVEVRTPGQNKRLDHTQKDQAGELVWSDDAEGATPNAAYASWMDKVSKLRLASYASAEDEVMLGSIEPFLQVALESGGKVTDVISFKKIAGSDVRYFVTSNFLGVHSHVVTSRAEPIEKDLGIILGASKS